MPNILAFFGSEAPEIGKGATIWYYSDSHATTIIAVSKSGREITVQEDKAIRTDKNGMSDSQSYTYEPNPNGRVSRFSLRKNGKWIPVGESMVSYGTSLTIGIRHEYYDYGF